MYILSCNSFNVCYGKAEEILTAGFSKGDAEYIIAQTHFRRTNEIDQLVDLGFCFHDRCLRLEISTNRARKYFLEDRSHANDILVCETEAFTDEMLELALKAFDTDRRFFLDRDFSPAERAYEVIKAYIAHYRMGPHKVIKAAHKDNVLGFVILCERENGAYENVLGVTKQDLMGKAAAVPLYSSVLGIVGAEGKRYLGIASSTNMASINLHMQLGARATDTIDRYILRKS